MNKLTPVAFIGIQISVNYFVQYCNIICKGQDSGLSLQECYDHFSEFINEINLTIDEDLFILSTDSLIETNETEYFKPNHLLIGAPINRFPETMSIKRMKTEMFNLLNGIDFIVDSDVSIVDLLLFTI